MARYLCCNGSEWEIDPQNVREGFTIPELEECLHSTKLFTLNLNNGRMVCTRNSTVYNEEASKIVKNSVEIVTPHLPAFKVYGDAIYCEYERGKELWRELHQP